MNFWGVLEANVPEGIARWWEIADSDSPDTRFVNAWSADGAGRWEEPDLDLGLTRLRKELGLKGEADFLPDEEGWLAQAKVVPLTEDYERELAAALRARRSAARP